MGWAFVVSVGVEDFEPFLAEHYEPVRRALWLALGDAGRAEEVAQDAFGRALDRWHSVSMMARPVTWVYVVALNQARRDLRRANRVAPVSPPAEAADVAGAVATTVVLRSALLSLAPRQRTAIVLRYLADLSLAEVAEAMGCAVGTVKSTLHSALVNLRVELEDEDG